MAKLVYLRPMLECNEIRETVAFYERLGFTCMGTWGHDPEKPTWCNVRRDDVALMFSRSEPHTHDDGTTHERHEPALAGSIYIDVDDADALFAELKSVVPAFEWEPETFPYGMREFGLRDCNGYLLIFGSSADPT